MLKNFKDVKNLGMQNDHATILKDYSDCYTMNAMQRQRMLIGGIVRKRVIVWVREDSGGLELG